MSLGKKQREFSRLVPRLIDQAHALGYEVTIGDVYRHPRVHGQIGEKKAYGHRNSNHKRKLAIDLNLFKDGKYLSSTEDHRLLGNWWERQGEDCRGGGRFNDGNHYSLEYNGCM